MKVSCPKVVIVMMMVMPLYTMFMMMPVMMVLFMPKDKHGHSIDN